MGLAAGTRLGPYEVVAPIGAGGMGEVYRAYDPRIGRSVALKVLPAGFSREPDRLQRFEREARAIGGLNHPNLLALYDVGTSEAGPYLVSELLEGESLRERLRRAPIPLGDALQWLAQIARGLSAAHERGIVHRDLKPENVFLPHDGRVKILDFGLAKVAPQASPDAGTTSGPVLTTEGVALGTVGYMAPEQVRGEAVGPAADIFSLGVLIYELIGGRAAFRRNTAVETLNAILTETPPPLSSAPAAVQRIVARCLEKAPDRRFQSAAEVAAALDAISAAASPARGSRPALLAPVAAAFLVVAALWLAYTNRGAPAPTPAVAAVATPRMTPFVSTEAVEKQPAWSPVGGLIAYVSDAEGNDDIWITDTSGGNPVNLTRAFSGTDAWPAWSPDGGSVAFYSEREGAGIYTMTALGANVRRVVPLRPGVLYTFSLSWSRDGSLIYTGFDASGIKRVYRVAAAGGEPSCLSCGLPDAPEGRAGELSPSGELLAFVSGLVGPRADLYVAHLPSGRLRKVTNQADWPHWSRDGRQIIFISSRDGQEDLWQLAIDPTGSPAGEPRKVTSALDAATFAVSPDGTQILAAKEQSRSHLWSVPLSAKEVSDLTSGSQLTSGSVHDDRGRWSADGESIFFQSRRRGSYDIWRLGLSGGAPERLTTAEGSELRPRPSPRGDWIAVDVLDGRGEFTQLMRPDGSQMHALDERWFQVYSQVCCASWSPDGSRLAVVAAPRGSEALSTIAVASVDPTSGRATAMRVLARLPGGTPQYARWSPDGRLIAYEAQSEGNWDLWVVNPADPVPTRLTRDPANDRQAAWQKDPLALYFIRGSREVWRIPFTASGRPAGAAGRWLVPPRRLRTAADSLDVHPSDDRLLLTLLADASDIWLVELR